MAMTSNNNPSKAITTYEGDPYPDVEARPLQLPDFVNIKPKNPNISLRWVNRSVGTQGSTQRLDEMIFAGFQPATPADCMMPNGLPIMANLIKDGKIIRGDLILLKISRAEYEGALKYNWERAVARLHPSRQLSTGQQQLSKAVSHAGVPRSVQPTLSQKLKAYRPGTSELTADPTFLAEDDKLSSERKE